MGNYIRKSALKSEKVTDSLIFYNEKKKTWVDILLNPYNNLQKWKERREVDALLLKYGACHPSDR